MTTQDETSQMKRRRSTIAQMLTVLALTCSQLAGAAGLLTAKHSNLATPDIRQHHVDVVIEDGYAITSIDQTFYNPNHQDIEAVFILYRRASQYGCYS
tara:strand:+ start:58813 stop:59106 length:294 start_codon:yes stop_codon:yes gene_type:complete